MDINLTIENIFTNNRIVIISLAFNQKQTMFLKKGTTHKKVG